MEKKQISFRGVVTLLLSLLAFSISAQTVTVSGTITDDTGFEVIGATVIVEGNPSHGTVTDIDGRYTISDVPSDGSLQISYVGFNTQVIPVNGRTTIDVLMSADTELLDELVVTGYGGVQKARSMTASAATVNVAEITRLPVTSIAEGLGGRVTGVITQQSRSEEHTSELQS